MEIQAKFNCLQHFVLSPLISFAQVMGNNEARQVLGISASHLKFEYSQGWFSLRPADCDLIRSQNLGLRGVSQW